MGVSNLEDSEGKSVTLGAEGGKGDEFASFSMASRVLSAARSFSLNVSSNASSRVIGSGILLGLRSDESEISGEFLPIDDEDRKESESDTVP